MKARWFIGTWDIVDIIAIIGSLPLLAGAVLVVVEVLRYMGVL